MKYAFLFIALAVSFCSCRKEHKNFNEKIIIDPSVTLAGKEFQLSCKTERAYAYEGIIVSSVQQDGNTITIDFKDVYYSPGTISGPRAATCQVSVGGLSNGSYSLIIHNGSKQSAGTLTVTDDGYSLFFYMLNDIAVAHYRFLKVPNHTIWGDITYQDASQKTIADIFTDSLEYYGAKPFAAQSGEYLYFNSKPGGITLGDASTGFHRGTPFTNQKTFVYSYSGSIDQIRSMLYNYGIKHEAAMFRIWTSDGNFFEFPMAPVFMTK